MNTDFIGPLAAGPAWPMAEAAAAWLTLRAVAQQVRKLEQELGVPLVARRPHGAPDGQGD